MKKCFVNDDSIVRKIWGKADTVIFIFAGAAAEFALNKAVDWLYYTGRLPTDPLGRLFSTVAYARQIIFSDVKDALKAIDTIAAIHKGVEKKRGAQIPDWAYRDVLFLLIDYSIRSYELLDRKLTAEEKEEIFTIFSKVGIRMQLNGLPADFSEWLIMRDEHLNKDLTYSNLTADLYAQYKKRLGQIRYAILAQVQFQLVPGRVKQILMLKNRNWLMPLLKVYKQLRHVKLSGFLRSMLLPAAYKTQIKNLDIE